MTKPLGWTNPIKRDVTVATSSTRILPRNPKRVWAMFVNAGANDVYIQLGATAVLNQGFKCISNGIFKIDRNTEYLDEVFAIADTASCLLVGIEAEN